MEISISLKNNSEREQVAKEVLKKILNKYNLNKWIICKDILIEQDSTGKAFPLIRLSAWNEKGEDGMLAQFLHEQFHWIEKGKEKEIENSMNKLRELFPNAPIEKPEGGGNEKSTYVHLIICRLEFLALKEIFNEEKAQDIVSGNKNYTWIRKTILDRGDEIDEIIKRNFPNLIL